MNKYIIFVLIGLFVLGLVFTSGCTGSQDNGQNNGSASNLGENDSQNNGADDAEPGEVLMPPTLPD